MTGERGASTSVTSGSLFDLARRAGLLDARRVPALTAAVARWGPTLAAPVAASAIATPNHPAVIDDRGALTFRDLDRQSTASAVGLQRLGIGRGARLGVACRNHREFVEVAVAGAKLGVQIVYLNTGFAAQQMNEVLVREQIDGLVIDAELFGLVDCHAFRSPVIVIGESPAASDASTGGSLGMPAAGSLVEHLDDVRRSGQDRWRQLLVRPSLPSAPVLLTSGTTGVPKGAQRTARADPAAAAILRLIPYRHDDLVAITSPLFHAWGLAQLNIALALGATVSISATFDADATLERLEAERVTVLVVVPAILQRLLRSPELDSTDLANIRVVASSGSALPVPVVEDWIERVGPNLYNLYGSTEVGQATLALPADLVASPNTAGRVLPGSTVEILDADGSSVASGAVGRIFVGNGSQFDGYTGGGGKEIIRGLMASGDVGFLDESGLLFITGRADDMIVSGGENVFPQEVEDVLLAHPDIVDVAVVGVDDDDFGQRLAAHVVLRPGAKLTAEQIKRAVGDTLARHKVPRDVTFTDELPRTTTGKIRRRQL